MTKKTLKSNSLFSSVLNEVSSEVCLVEKQVIKVFLKWMLQILIGFRYFMSIIVMFSQILYFNIWIESEKRFITNHYMFV